MANDIKMTGNTKLKTLKQQFTAKFPNLCVGFSYEDGTNIKDKETIATARKASSKEDLSIVGHLGAGTFEKRCKDIYGINAKLAFGKKAGRGYTYAHPTTEQYNLTLSELNDWSKKNGYADMIDWSKTL